MIFRTQVQLQNPVALKLVLDFDYNFKYKATLF